MRKPPLGRIDVFAESLAWSLSCPRRRRWLICTPWLALPFLWTRSKRIAQENREFAEVEALIHRVGLLDVAGLSDVVRRLDSLMRTWNPDLEVRHA